MQEEWKIYKETDYPRYGKRVYEVSNLGRVKLNGEIVTFDYSSPLYFKKGGVMIHRIVAELFIPNPENKPCVDHIDTDIHNNRVDNLRWVTIKENNNNPITKQHMSECSKGFKHSEETKRKISAASKARKMPAEVVKRIVETRKANGYKPSDETKKKISDTLKLKGVWNKGKKGLYHHTEEAKQKMSAAAKGKKPSEYQLKKLAESIKGTIWINNGIKRKRIFKDDLSNYTDWNLGWKI